MCVYQVWALFGDGVPNFPIHNSSNRSFILQPSSFGVPACTKCPGYVNNFFQGTKLNGAVQGAIRLDATRQEALFEHMIFCCTNPSFGLNCYLDLVTDSSWNLRHLESTMLWWQPMLVGSRLWVGVHLVGLVVGSKAWSLLKLECMHTLCHAGAKTQPYN
jgi:hypothetical protein